ncbi:hypothetical protein VKA52_15370 [Halobacillus sp. HZG1]|nr:MULTISPECIES: hypothetical protein [Halobacillus]MEC3885112.1 hypothetical protein [Halobacillus sp. HZG1]
MNQSNNPGQDVFAKSGTNVSEVKRRNEQSGLSYNQVKEMLAHKQNQK